MSSSPARPPLRSPLLVYVSITTPGVELHEVFGGSRSADSDKVVQDDPFTFSFSGQHDNGGLAALREGPYKDLSATLSCEAKTKIDEIIKSIMSPPSS